MRTLPALGILPTETFRTIRALPFRRTALEAAGGWSSDTIWEDSDLGLTIMELGWRAPDAAYAVERIRQREPSAVQIAKCPPIFAERAFTKGH
jgi:hypothetical protein